MPSVSWQRRVPPAVWLDVVGTPADLEIFAEGLAFPEGPVAFDDGSLVVVEVAGGRVTRISPAGEKVTIAGVGGGPNGVAAGIDGALYVCNNGGLPWTTSPDGASYPVDPATGSMTPGGYQGGWLERVDPVTGQATRVVDFVSGRQLSAPNDIVAGADGALWFTDTGKTNADTTALGSVVRCGPDGSEAVTVAYGLAGPNGIGLSPDGSRLYVSDTPTGRIYEWDVSALGEVTGPRRHGARVRGRLPAAEVVDSLAVDALDRILVALPGSGAIAVVQPDGGVWAFRVPDPMPTNVCFGGPDGTTAFVTLGGFGRVARFSWDCPGVVPVTPARG